MHVVVAEGALVEQIIRTTYPLWNEGLTPHAYAQWNAAQLRTAWGSRHLQRVALLDDDGTLLATAKRYRFAARLDGRDVRVLGIGAVFTPEDRRRRGHAAALIEQLVDAGRRDGDDIAMLFSEIDPAFYERLSFTQVPLNEVQVNVHTKDGAPATLVRAGHESDLAALAAMHAVRAAGARFSLVRDSSLIQFALARRRLLAGLGPPGQRQVEFHVIEEGATAVAYAVLTVDENGWTLSDAGDRDPAGARLGALLQVLLAREPSRRPPVIRAWWPQAFAVPPQVHLSNARVASDVLMMRALSDVRLPSGDDVFLWRGDFF